MSEPTPLLDALAPRAEWRDPEQLADGVLAAVGNTPLVRLRRLFPEAGFELYGKLEALNPGGSVKDRPALAILLHAVRHGEVGPDSVVVESSSGNFAIGLAQACTYLGLRFVCVVDAKTTEQNVSILRMYGAEVDVVQEPDPVTGEFLVARLQRVRALLAEHPNGFWPNQYANLQNAGAHHGTMREIESQLGGSPDYVVCATSTCGTLRGCAGYVRQHRLRTRLVAVDAVGSVIFGLPPQKRLIPGHGAAVRPGLWDAALADRVVHVTDRDCVIGCRSLLRREAILAGGSSGAIVAALAALRDEIEHGARCVAILPDRGERYLDTIYSDDWVERHIGDLEDAAVARA